MNTEPFHTHQPFQYVSVPQPFVPAVYRLLAELRQATVGAGKDPAQRSPDLATEGWTEEKPSRPSAGDTETT